MGLAAVMGCHNAGAKRIIAVDVNPDKFEKAKVFGATEFLNPNDHSEPISQVLSKMTNGGVDFSLECVGNVGVMVRHLNKVTYVYILYFCYCLYGLNLNTSYFQAQLLHIYIKYCVQY